MNLRTKIMASFASLEADLRTYITDNCDHNAAGVAASLVDVQKGHDAFTAVAKQDEPITIEGDAAVGHVE